MVSVLAVADEVDDALCADPGSVRGVKVILACGDLPFDYLGYLMDALECPLVFVPGNHDRDVRGYRTARSGLTLRAGMPSEPPWPPGAVNTDGRVVDVAGLRVAGLGGSLRYSDGPNQYSQRAQTRRARRLARRARLTRWRDGRPVDVVLAHAPPRGVGDGDDLPHQGFDCLAWLMGRLRARLLLHGHVHPFGEHPSDLRLGDAVVRNVVGKRVFDIPSAADTSPATGQRSMTGAPDSAAP